MLRSGFRLVANFAAIRAHQPNIILCNAPDDRHPDHGRAAQLITDAAFLAGLVKIETFAAAVSQAPWRPTYVLHYIQDRYLKPDFVVDITSTFEQKINAIKAYKTQFYNPADSNTTQTYISTPQFLESVIARAAMFGKMIGVKYAEGFISKKVVGLSNLSGLIQNVT